MECKICGSKEIKGDCQYINGDYYHNHCIEQLEQENKELNSKIDKAIEFIKKAQYDDELKSYVYGLNATGTRKLLEILKDSNVNE